MISQVCKKCKASGWCEYDPITDTIYPNNEGACPERMEKTMAEFDLAAFAKEVHENAVAHGWWEEKRSAEEVRALIHSEWSEALEEARAGRAMVWHECKNTLTPCTKEACGGWRDGQCLLMERNDKPEGIAVELMDGVIRILDWFGQMGGFSDTLKKIVSFGFECHESDIWHNRPLEAMSVGELVDVLHYHTANAARSKAGMPLLAAMGMAIAWVNAQGVDAIELLERKHRYNKTRPYKHGKKF